ncbi:MAG TPA: von Willebrand factor type A domain-containing protein [Vicinamibacteria bacterium]|nr:von Willebrand factor type A domain-containing protein [Vicinamibacteria bacterium]
MRDIRECRAALALVLTLLTGCQSAPQRDVAGSPAPPSPPPPTTAAPLPAPSAPLAKAARVVGSVAALNAPAELPALGYGAAVASDFDTEAYDRVHENGFLGATTNPLSTFSIDVDTASYSNVRRFLAGGRLPPKDAVRTEELLNYFRYAYPEPKGDAPFSVTTELGPCPWTPAHRLLRIGLRGRAIDQARVPPRNLVFLLDVSGSMMPPNKLPLLKSALGLLVDQLRPQDRVAVVVYAGAAGLVLPPTPGDRKGEIREALSALEAGGSTAGGAGIQLAYGVASEAFVPDGINRVILATDGDFNVGITSQGDLLRLIEGKRKSGVFLSVLGFGDGNLKDSTMEKLADSGDGNYAYIDSIAEARKVLVAEAGATLVTVAKDVKIQVEWNPARVAAYRLIGYENRMLRAEDFNDDRKDAGEIGAGHTVTALYEVAPAGVAVALPSVDPLKYQAAPLATARSASDELATVKLRYKEPDGDASRLLSAAVNDAGRRPASADLRFAAAVVEFGMLLRESEHRGAASFEQALELARAGLGDDPSGLRAEFVSLVKTAQGLSGAMHLAQTR